MLSHKTKMLSHTKVTTICLSLFTIVLSAAVITQNMSSRHILADPGHGLTPTNGQLSPGASSSSDLQGAKPQTPSKSPTEKTAARTSVLAATKTTTSGKRQPASVQIDEQFTGDSLNDNLWEAMTYTKAYRNNEEQDYTPAQVSVANGNLQITANRDANGAWHSGEVHSKWDYIYGEFEVRMALSTTGPGVWPAAWLMGRTDNWPNNGEIDIMENINGDPTIYGTIHGGGTGSTWHWAIGRTYASIDVKQYHTYKVVKQPSYMSWWIDGVKRGEWRQSQMPKGGIWPFESHRNFGLLNLAIGGNWPSPSDASTPNTIIMYVDYFTVKNGS